MKIVLASDHGGYLLNQYLIEKLKEQNIFLIDLGTDSPDKSVDYPDFALSLGKYLNENSDFFAFAKSKYLSIIIGISSCLYP